MTFLFDILFSIFAILYLPIMLIRGKWHAGMKIRFGAIPEDTRAALRECQNIWLHAVSVGEVVAVEPILQRLKVQYPTHQIVLSVSTTTGYGLACRKYSSAALVIWSPVDLSFVVRSFIAAIKPEIYIVAETELWPNLLLALARENVPMILVNGRISDAAIVRYKLARWALQSVLAKISVFCVQSDLDVERMVAIGAPQDRVHNVGNIKFDLVCSTNDFKTTLPGMNAGRTFWVAGSTRPGEEDIVADIFNNVRVTFPQLRLIIAPRHPERAGEVVETVHKKGLRSVLFSRLSPRELAEDEVLIVDTIGQLFGLYALATVVFVGKSLTVPGGHNIIEPAVFGKPILIGPKMQNFKDVTAAFEAHQALIKVADADELKEELRRLLSSEADRMDLGRRAREVVAQNRGALDRTMQKIVEVYGSGERQQS